MTLKLESVVTAIKNALRQIGELSGNDWSGLTDDSRPFEDCDGFDSVTAEEATVFVEQELKITLSDNPFAARRSKTVTIREIAMSALEMVA